MTANVSPARDLSISIAFRHDGSARHIRDDARFPMPRACALNVYMHYRAIDISVIQSYYTLGRILPSMNRSADDNAIGRDVHLHLACSSFSASAYIPVMLPRSLQSHYHSRGIPSVDAAVPYALARPHLLRQAFFSNPIRSPDLFYFAYL